MTRLALFVPLLLAIAILTLAVPRVVASVLTAPAHRTLLVIEDGGSSDPERLDQAADYIKRATEWEQSARRFGQHGFLRLFQALQTKPDDPKRRALIGEATASLRQSLRLSPSRAHPWVRLAFARVLEGADPSELVNLVAQSIRTGPYVAGIAVTRLDLILRMWNYLTPEMRTYAMKQVRYIWPQAGREVLQLLRDTPRPEIIRFALRPYPEALQRVDAVLARRSK